MMASKGWKVVLPHVPMIKFRKGGINRVSAGTTSAPSSAQAVSSPGRQPSGRASGPQVIVLPTIDDFQLPRRYQRKPIDDKEIAYINRGGPE